MSASTSLIQNGTNGFVGFGAGSLAETRTGWTAGAGLEWMFGPKWSAKIEYLHYDLGTATFAWQANSAFFLGAPFFGATSVYQSNVSSARFEGNLVRAGLNLHF